MGNQTTALKGTLAIVSFLTLAGCNSDKNKIQEWTEASAAATTGPVSSRVQPSSYVYANPNLGVNLEGHYSSSRHQMYTDAMRESRPWGSVNEPWDEKTAVDAKGWPKGDAGVVVMDSGPTANEPSAQYLKPGVYKLKFRGRARVWLNSSPNASISNYLYSKTTNISTADITIRKGCSQLILSFSNTVGGVRNVSLIRPGYKGTGKRFTDEFLAAIAPFSTIRFMDFLSTNSNRTANWSERPTRRSATYATNKGGAYEEIIQLSNLTGKDIWINIPARATDEYIFQLATLLKNNLNSGNNIYLEYGNELWNWIFPMATENMNRAVREAIAGDKTLTGGTRCTQAMFDAETGNCNRYWAAYYRVAKRTVRISEIFERVYGASAINQQVRPVLATQFGYRAIGERQLAYIKRYKGAPRNFIYGIAGAPYFYVAESLQKSRTLTVDQIISSYRTSMVRDYFPSFKKGVSYTGGEYTNATQLALAKYYGIKSLAYEGGNDYGQHNVSMKAKIASNFDPRMYTLFKNYYSQWFGCGNDLFMQFTLSSVYGQWGSWGLTNNIENLTAPKYRAAKDVASMPLSSFTTCQ